MFPDAPSPNFSFITQCFQSISARLKLENEGEQGLPASATHDSFRKVKSHSGKISN